MFTTTIDPEQVAAVTVIDGSVIVDPITECVPQSGYAVPMSGRARAAWAAGLPAAVGSFLAVHSDAFAHASTYLMTQSQGAASPTPDVVHLEVVRLFERQTDAALAAIITGEDFYYDVAAGLAPLLVVSDDS